MNCAIPTCSKPQHTQFSEEKVQLSIAKAKRIATAYRLTLDDVAFLSPKFWKFHSDPIVCDDPAATTLLAIQFNLVIGTILDTVGKRPDLIELLHDLLEYKISGQFCLTEVDHGLDAANIETRATALQNETGFILHTPHLGAAKYMPPTVPCGIPCIAVVMARLFKNGADLGIKPFLVSINDGKVMCPGVVARLLPPRGGSKPVRHSITSFNHVVLPQSALLQRDIPADRGSDENKRLDHLRAIWRVAVGSLALSATTIPGLARSAFTAAMYSKHRRIGAGSSPTSVPIIQFKTQYTPILTAFAQSFVLAEFYKSATEIFRDASVDFRAVALRHMQDAGATLSERCGAQGLFNYNGICELHVRAHADMRGIATAEGDILGLSIRLATELLLDRYSLACGPSTASPLALHARGLLSTCRTTLQEVGNHRSEAFNRRILPHCRPIVEAIGMQFAYDAAVAAGLDDGITRLYLGTAMRQQSLFDAEEKALGRALPKLDEWMGSSEMASYVTAPIASAEKWLAFISQLEVFE
ncbi:acyl-CoA dehydrogenase NM domain-like protein [Mycena capillaripes]|nr:acyl-CoA dehydrogenase NM domain-like protein [Mycena capillaripes]